MRKVKDNLAERVTGTYRLDPERFREIVNTVYDATEEARETSEAMDMSKPHVNLDLGRSEINLWGEFQIGGEGDIVLFDYVGRLVAGSKINEEGSLYLQTFRPKNPERTGTPKPDLLNLLREYVV